MERYADYQMPLTNIQSSTLVKQLAAAGTRISVTPEQAATLGDLKPLLDVTDKKETVVQADESAVSSPEELEQLAKSMGIDMSKSSSSEADEMEDDEMEDEEMEDGVAPRKKRSTSQKAKTASLALHGKFVDVTKLLPPLPEKGSFQVEKIKESQYFFS
jgi:DNA-directed RNA polymerase